MNQIAPSTSTLNPATFDRLYSKDKSASQAKADAPKDSVNRAHVSAPDAKAEAFANLFDDRSLEQLQRNLESIASLAEQTLKRYQAGTR